MGPCHQETAPVEEENAIGELDRFRSVRNQERGASSHEPFQGDSNLTQGFAIEMGSWLIQQEEAGLA